MFNTKLEKKNPICQCLLLTLSKMFLYYSYSIDSHFVSGVPDSDVDVSLWNETHFVLSYSLTMWHSTDDTIMRRKMPNAFLTISQLYCTKLVRIQNTYTGLWGSALISRGNNTNT